MPPISRRRWSPAWLVALVASLLSWWPASPAAAQAPSLSDDAYARARYLKRTVRIPMRDGVRLFTQLYVPRDAGDAHRYGIVLTRTPFFIGAETDSAVTGAIALDPYMLRDGYVFVQQEVRGRYRSEGTFENVRPSRTSAGGTDETTDAEDTIRWLLANVSGHNGRVALHGTSYGGFYAALGALSGHPAIHAVSLQAPVADYWREDFHRNGAFALTSLWAVPIFGTPRPAPTAAHWWAPAYGQIPDSAMAQDYAWLLHLGSLANVGWLGNDRWWRALVDHPDHDAFWRARALPPRLRGLTAPTLLVGGWFDAENLYGTLAVQRALAARSPQAPVTFVMGPFGHRQWSARGVAHTTHGALHFGDSLEVRFQRDIEAPFFRRHLADTTSAGTDASVRVFDTGRPAWREVARWPLPDARRLTWQLRADGTLDTLDTRRPVATRRWTSDPQQPVPSRCTGTTIEDGSPNLVMSDDQRCVTGRADVLSFTTAPLARDLTLAGAITATLRFATTGTDADLVVKIIDVYPDDAPDPRGHPDSAVHVAGRQQLVRAEVLRGRYRLGDTPTPFTPGVASAITITLPDVLHTVRAGHRLMVQVQSSWFPLIDRNPQRFVPNIFRAQAADFVAARHTLVLGGRGGSRIVIPVSR